MNYLTDSNIVRAGLVLLIRFFVITISIVIVATSPVTAAQESRNIEDEVILSINVHDPPTITNGKFHFRVLYTSAVDDKATEPNVYCGEGVMCQEDSTISQSPLNLTEEKEYVASLPDDSLDLMEITAELTVQGHSAGFHKRQSRIIILGFRHYILATSLSPEDQVLGNDRKNVYFRFADTDGPVTPSLPVDLVLHSDCADFLKPGGADQTFSPQTSVRVDDTDSTQWVTVRPHLWWSDYCPIVAQGLIIGGDISRQSQPFVTNILVKPAYIPALTMSLLGVVLQYFLGGLVLLVFKAQNEKNDGQSIGSALNEVFVGKNGAYIASVLFKGVLTFLIALMMMEQNVFGITVDKGKFIGFLTLGFLLGFWPIEKIWGELARASGAGPTQTPPTGATALQKTPSSSA